MKIPTARPARLMSCGATAAEWPFLGRNVRALIGKVLRRIGQRAQFANGILVLGQGIFRLGIDDGEHGSSVNATHPESITFDAYDTVFFVKNGHGNSGLVVGCSM